MDLWDRMGEVDLETMSTGDIFEEFCPQKKKLIAVKEKIGFYNQGNKSKFYPSEKGKSGFQQESVESSEQVQAAAQSRDGSQGNPRKKVEHSGLEQGGE